jgi:hypothetical protein
MALEHASQGHSRHEVLRRVVKSHALHHLGALIYCDNGRLSGILSWPDSSEFDISRIFVGIPHRSGG